MTDEQSTATSKKKLSRSLSRAKVKDLPSIIKPNKTELFLAKSSCDLPSSSCFFMLSLDAYKGNNQTSKHSSSESD